jgi:hypothetical protein
MKIAVNRNDIAQGMPGNGWRCPVALAIARDLGCHTMVGEGWAVTVAPDFTVASDFRSLDLPPEVQTWIRKFDRGETVEPFEFELVT